jgi:hypothetical protein
VVPGCRPREGENAVDGNGREGGTYKAKPRGLGRPTRRSATFIVAGVLFALVVIAALLLGLL